MSNEHVIDQQPEPEMPYPSYADLFKAVEAHLLPAKLRFYEGLGVSFVLGRRAGVEFEDAFSGRRLINCHSNGGVFNLGHNNPRIVEALRRRLGQVDVGNHHFASPWRARLAERLAATTGGELSKVVFG
ncbi:MAG: aminotransferase class III-fold pyridoxal phosphate-dependent enzyme, partial [Deltaproteobacteria bacterium]